MIINRRWCNHPPILGLRNNVKYAAGPILRCLHPFSFFSTTTPVSDRSAQPSPPPLRLSKNHPTHMIFGANTDVGKTVISTSLVRASLESSHTLQQQPPPPPSAAGHTVHYVKPLGCGEDADSDFVRRHVGRTGESNILAEPPRLECHDLFQWQTPASPHIASRRENSPVADVDALRALRSTLAGIQGETGDDAYRRTFVELAGGVLSPSAASPLNDRARHARGDSSDESSSSPSSWGWSTQADLYQPLRLPVLLVGDGGLGGIATTLSALESLLLRGYDVHAIALLDGSDPEDGYGNNADAIREYASRNLRLRNGGGRALFDDPERTIVSLPGLPEESVPLDGWYTDERVVTGVEGLERVLVERWQEDVGRVEELGVVGTGVLWWPFTQHKDPVAVGVSGEGKVKVGHTATVIDAASGDNFSILRPSASTEPSTSTTTATTTLTALARHEHFDACASWWTQGLGHGESSLALAAASAAGRYGHVIFPNVVHEPAVALAERLVKSTTGPGHGWAERCFFSDDGSTAMEVAIKMGMRKFQTDHGVEDGRVLTVLAQKDCYHGDTLGVMDVAEPSVFNEGQHPWYEPKGLFLGYPTLRYRDGVLGLSFPEGDGVVREQEFDGVDDAMDVEGRLESELYGVYVEEIRNEWDAYEADEGGSRCVCTCVLICECSHVCVCLCFGSMLPSYAKLLTGGLVPMSVTLASKDVFDAFLGDTKAEALLHGHSYTAHPVGCVSGLHALDVFDTMLAKQDEPTGMDGADTADGDSTAEVRYFDPRDVRRLSELPAVQESMGLGTVLAVTVRPDGDGGGGYAAASKSAPIVEYLFENGVYARPLGNVVYVMVSPLTSREECKRLCGLLREAIESVG